MKNSAKKYSRNLTAAALFGGLIFMTPASLQAKSNGHSSVHITVNVHGSDINVSQEALEESVDKLLEAAQIDVVEKGADANVIELKIDIFKSEDKGFKIDCDWDDDPTPEVEEHCDEQDEIDQIVEDEVHKFVEFIHKS